MAPDAKDPLGRNKATAKQQDEMRRSLRRETTVELRKNKRDETLEKRRNVHEEDDTSDSESESDSGSDYEREERRRRGADGDGPSLAALQQLVLEASASDADVQYKAVIAIKKMTYRTESALVYPLINCGAIPTLVNCLRTTNEELQFQALWALTNIASGNSYQTQAVAANSDAVPMFIQLMSSGSHNVCEQAVWTLGNIIGDGIGLRDYVVSLGIIPVITSLIRPDMPTRILRNVAWTVSNMCRKKPSLPPQALMDLIPVINALVDHTDHAILFDTLWALRYLTDSGSDGIEVVLRSGILPKLIALISNPENDIHPVALTAIGNIAVGTEAQTQELLNYGVLSQVNLLLRVRHPKQSMCKSVIWFLSNVTAGTREQIQAVINAQLIPLVISHLENGEFRTQKEAVYVMANIASTGTKDQVAYLKACGTIPHLCKLLDCRDTEVTQVILDAIYDILKAYDSGSTEGESVCVCIEACGGLDSIETLLEHRNVDIYDQAYKIIQDYFPEGGREDITVAPQTSNGTYQFGAIADGTQNQGFQF